MIPLLLLSPLALFAAQTAEEQVQPSYRFMDILLWLLPILMLGGMLWWFIGRNAKRQRRYMEQSEQHQIRIEQALNRIATALEKKDNNDA